MYQSSYASQKYLTIQKDVRKGRLFDNPAPCYFPLTSIIAADELNFGVRDGNRCGLTAKSTGLSKRKAVNGFWQARNERRSLRYGEPEALKKEFRM